MEAFWQSRPCHRISRFMVVPNLPTPSSSNTSDAATTHRSHILDEVHNPQSTIQLDLKQWHISYILEEEDDVCLCTCTHSNCDCINMDFSMFTNSSISVCGVSQFEFNGKAVGSDQSRDQTNEHSWPSRARYNW